MRLARIASVVSLIAPLVALASACGSNDASASSDDTCAFLADADNCYLQLAAAIDDCLGDVAALDVGILSSDGTSCAYVTGRTVTFGGDARTFEVGKTRVDFAVSVGGKTCVHVVDLSPSGGALTITGPDGHALVETLTSSGDASIVCPDGSQHHVSGRTIIEGTCSDTSNLTNLPRIEVTGPGASSVSGGVSAQKKVDYACAIRGATP